MSRYFRADLQLRNSPVDRARELFKPSKDWASLRAGKEKKNLVSSFFVSGVISEVGFWPLRLMLPGLGPNP